MGIFNGRCELDAVAESVHMENSREKSQALPNFWSALVLTLLCSPHFPHSRRKGVREKGHLTDV
jgi:hypothetical protein